jgi:hypothetical protein
MKNFKMTIDEAFKTNWMNFDFAKVELKNNSSKNEYLKNVIQAESDNNWDNFSRGNITYSVKIWNETGVIETIFATKYKSEAEKYVMGNISAIYNRDRRNQISEAAQRYLN